MKNSIYLDKERIEKEVLAGNHRTIVGGLWDELGLLQINFLKTQGLRPEHTLLDIGCGCLRGGVHFIEYLLPGNYYGVDSNPSLLRAGRDIELNARGLLDKLPESNLLASDTFEFERLGGPFDFAWAQSLFTHLPANVIRLCLHQLKKVLGQDAKFYATFFEVPQDHPRDRHWKHPHGMMTHAWQDPYHYSVADFVTMCRESGWHLHYHGDWGHPRDQHMLVFSPEGGARHKSPKLGKRDLPLEQAGSLPAGAEHYRAYVGPPNRFDFMGATQFALLFALGLREHHRLLDFGCGSLRVGRLLIPYLLPDGYYGLEPNAWLIEDALDRELGSDILALKRPHFRHNDDFRCDTFGKTFDFVLAQSILTHTGPDLFAKIVMEMAKVLSKKGRLVFNYWDAAGKEETREEGWIYPHCAYYSWTSVEEWCRNAGLRVVRIPWYHPCLTWCLAVEDGEQLPSRQSLDTLQGVVLFEEQFADSQRLRHYSQE